MNCLNCQIFQFFSEGFSKELEPFQFNLSEYLQKIPEAKIKSNQFRSVQNHFRKTEKISVQFQLIEDEMIDLS